MTFGVLAMGCTRSKEARELLEGLEIVGYVPNVVILGTLISNACRALNTNYVMEMIHYMKVNRITPNEQILTYLNKYEETLTKMQLSKVIYNYINAAYYNYVNSTKVFLFYTYYCRGLNSRNDWH